MKTEEQILNLYKEISQDVNYIENAESLDWRNKERYDGLEAIDRVLKWILEISDNLYFDEYESNLAYLVDSEEQMDTIL